MWEKDKRSPIQYVKEEKKDDDGNYKYLDKSIEEVKQDISKDYQENKGTIYKDASEFEKTDDTKWLETLDNQGCSLLPYPVGTLRSLGSSISEGTLGEDIESFFTTWRNKSKEKDFWVDARGRVYCVDWCSIKCNQATHFVKMTAPLGLRNVVLKDGKHFAHHSLNTYDVIPILNIPYAVWNLCYSLLNPITLALSLANFAKPPYVWKTIPGPCIFIPLLFWKGNDDINFLVQAIPAPFRTMAWGIGNVNNFWRKQNLTKDCTLTCIWGGEFTIYDSGQNAKPIPYDMVTGLIGPDIGAMLHNLIGIVGNYLPGGKTGLGLQALLGVADSALSAVENAEGDSFFDWKTFGQGVAMTAIGMGVGVGSSKVMSIKPVANKMQVAAKWFTGPTMNKFTERWTRISNATNPVQIVANRRNASKTKNLSSEVNTALNKVVKPQKTVKSLADLKVEYSRRRAEGVGFFKANWEHFKKTCETFAVTNEYNNRKAQFVDAYGKNVDVIKAIKDKDTALNNIKSKEGERDSARTRKDSVKEAGGKKMTAQEKTDAKRKKFELETERDNIEYDHSPDRPNPKDPGQKPTREPWGGDSNELKAKKQKLEDQKKQDIADLAPQKKKEIDELGPQKQKELDDLNNEYNRDKSKLQREETAEINAISDPKKKQRDKKKQEIRDKYKQKREERREAFKRDQENINTKYNEKEAEINTKYGNKEEFINKEKYNNEEQKLAKDSKNEETEWNNKQEEKQREWQEKKDRYDAGKREQEKWDLENQKLKELDEQIRAEQKKLDDNAAFENYERLQAELKIDIEAYNTAIKQLQSNDSPHTDPHADKPNRIQRVIDWIKNGDADDDTNAAAAKLKMLANMGLDVLGIIFLSIWELIQDKEGDIEQGGGDDQSQNDSNDDSNVSGDDAGGDDAGGDDAGGDDAGGDDAGGDDAGGDDAGGDDAGGDDAGGDDGNDSAGEPTTADSDSAPVSDKDTGNPYSDVPKFELTDEEQSAIETPPVCKDPTPEDIKKQSDDELEKRIKASNDEMWKRVGGEG